jgi:integrase
MSVYKPKGSPYFHFDFVWHGRRFHGSTGCTGKRSALAYEARQREAAVLPPRNRPPLTLDEACGLYEEHAGSLPSWNTIEYMTAALIAGLGGNRLLAEIGQRDLQVHFAKRRNGRANASVNRELDNARAIWRRADKARFDVGEMPDWNALRLKVPKRSPRELSANEEDGLFASLRADVADACDFALKSGWRRSEVIGLRWSDCDLQARQARTKIKGGDEIKRPLTPTLLALVANQPKVGPFVFTYVCRKTRGKRLAGERYPLTATVLRSAMAAAKTAAKIEGFRFHDFRHTTGTRIVRSTGSLAAAKAALAHRSISTTLRYAHVLDDDVRHALEAAESRNSPEVAESGTAKTSRFSAEDREKRRA